MFYLTSVIQHLVLEISKKRIIRRRNAKQGSIYFSESRGKWKLMEMSWENELIHCESWSPWPVEGDGDGVAGWTSIRGVLGTGIMSNASNTSLSASAADTEGPAAETIAYFLLFLWEKRCCRFLFVSESDFLIQTNSWNTELNESNDHAKLMQHRWYSH